MVVQTDKAVPLSREVVAIEDSLATQQRRRNIFTRGSQVRRSWRRRFYTWLQGWLSDDIPDSNKPKRQLLSSWRGLSAEDKSFGREDKNRKRNTKFKQIIWNNPDEETQITREIPGYKQ